MRKGIFFILLRMFGIKSVLERHEKHEKKYYSLFHSPGHCDCRQLFYSSYAAPVPRLAPSLEGKMQET